jgi:hypothetical protein
MPPLLAYDYALEPLCLVIPAKERSDASRDPCRIGNGQKLVQNQSLPFFAGMGPGYCCAIPG